MNKRLIAFALVLLIVVGGVFAALPDYTSATAILKGTIGDVFKHGFLIGDSTDYESGITLPGNAFEVDPSFTYGFTAKHGSMFKSQLSVTAFSKTGGSVEIDSVTITVGDSTPVVTSWTSETDTFDVLTYGSDDLYMTVTKDATITITPKSSEGKPSGQYTSTVTVNLETVS